MFLLVQNSDKDLSLENKQDKTSSLSYFSVPLSNSLIKPQLNHLENRDENALISESNFNIKNLNIKDSSYISSNSNESSKHLQKLDKCLTSDLLQKLDQPSPVGSPLNSFKSYSDFPDDISSLEFNPKHSNYKEEEDTNNNIINENNLILDYNRSEKPYEINEPAFPSQSYNDDYKTSNNYYNHLDHNTHTSLNHIISNKFNSKQINKLNEPTSFYTTNRDDKENTENTNYFNLTNLCVNNGKYKSLGRGLGKYNKNNEVSDGRYMNFNGSIEGSFSGKYDGSYGDFDVNYGSKYDVNYDGVYDSAIYSFNTNTNINTNFNNSVNTNNTTKIITTSASAPTSKFDIINTNLKNLSPQDKAKEEFTPYNIFTGKKGWVCSICKNFNFESKYIK